MPSAIRLTDAFRAYQDLPHQIAAAQWLDDHLTAEQRTQFQEMFRADPPVKAGSSPSPGVVSSSVLLQVPYEYQNDNRTGSGYRECFSSSCAMVARFFGRVTSDDQYNQVRARYGDTTDAAAQLAALKSLGLQASFRQDGKAEDLERILREGRPVPVGWLHHGTPAQPSGGGHWSVVIGYDPQAFTFNDPNGEANLLAGGYVNTGPSAGRAVRYSRKNWLPRWRVGGTGGWYFDVKP